MLPAKRLLLWHQAKEAKKRAEAELDSLEREKREWQKKLESLEQSLASLAAPASLDDEIARLLREQDLWAARKDWERFITACQERETALMEEIHRLQFEIWKWEQELDDSLLNEYHRIAERAAHPIVEVRNQSCMGCFLPLPLGKISEWRRGKGLVTCDECGRILV
ncbi:C4-type zinc ribbon domain-containing protein [Brevibacillus sp. H7]|uniref:C4-type zinc ribbon domain-containing protein n=1 Tax=Brevibacillus sp. H7 TaxID=3349138 RepID=UPI0037F34F6E